MSEHNIHFLEKKKNKQQNPLKYLSELSEEFPRESKMSLNQPW